MSFRVVLVRPAFPGNIGSVARVMRNFGVSELRLVRPHADPKTEEARRLSTHGEAILHQAVSVANLGDAVADCDLVVATSARRGGLFRLQTVVTPREVAPRIAQATKAALVFGPEQSGLTNEEISRCHFLITIPASDEYPALNLAQAVGVCLYEVFLISNDTASARPQAVAQAAQFSDQERMFDQFRDALTAIHFLYGEKADSLMHAIRHLIGRAEPTAMEVNVLLGLARQIRWFADQKQV
jgi:tRNA/rRNA methyltransferase